MAVLVVVVVVTGDPVVAAGAGLEAVGEARGAGGLLGAAAGGALDDEAKRPARSGAPTWSPTSPTAHHAITAMTQAHTAHSATCPVRRATPTSIMERPSAADGCAQVKNMTIT
ncbi:hypothetical protein acdb102_33250 [Acidothermaceae bacterium B102]|nr:hypothetical protein acdb102_33250 [Acidothermaceae bacterium B102]